MVLASERNKNSILVWKKRKRSGADLAKKDVVAQERVLADLARRIHAHST